MFLAALLVGVGPVLLLLQLLIQDEVLGNQHPSVDLYRPTAAAQSASGRTPARGLPPMTLLAATKLNGSITSAAEQEHRMCCRWGTALSLVQAPIGLPARHVVLTERITVLSGEHRFQLSTHRLDIVQLFARESSCLNLTEFHQTPLYTFFYS
ncbi:hypothetical protein BDV95DRAFT_27305 [Massariosphaeria phaeospora]|uniref:Uncharacterized protein n=1 Tax=Massariosphaeria phaeospora TaxID=100035 RepID=A0A7C8MC84_9PLEO|nr:hypothetical protein BDV95DRAFT_27305 [Massariosphaeria phaeospora]